MHTRSVFRIARKPLYFNDLRAFTLSSVHCFCSAEMCYADVRWTCYSKFLLCHLLSLPKSETPVTVRISELWALLFAYKCRFPSRLPAHKTFFRVIEKKCWQPSSNRSYSRHDFDGAWTRSSKPAQNFFSRYRKKVLTSIRISAILTPWFRGEHERSHRNPHIATHSHRSSPC